MESIGETNFDLVIEGTGLAQSLLALALSRSDKKILHLDQNSYYGGEEAALSLQDAEEWVSKVDRGSLCFSDARIVQSESSKLGFSRAYSLALAPQIIYSKSVLLPTLVSSKVYRQLDFLAVGAWWIYEDGGEEGSGSLKRIPGSREDVFADNTIDLRAKRSLMKFLKFITDPEAFMQAIETSGHTSLEDFLSQEFNISLDLQPILHALTLSSMPASQTKTSFALPRILRHLSSIGVFGPGFGAVIPKWGGLAELTQVGCRACAVGGGIYMLGQAIQSAGHTTSDELARLRLDNGEEVKTRWRASQRGTPPTRSEDSTKEKVLTRSVTIVSSPLSTLLPPIADGAPPSACTMVVFPPGSLQHDGSKLNVPIYFMIHTSETGECPNGQSILYGSIRADDDEGKQWLEKAVHALLNASSEAEEDREVLWSLLYSQEASKTEDMPSQGDTGPEITDRNVLFSKSSADLAFDDSVLREVRTAWQHITGNDSGFMEFEDREVGEYDEEGQ